LNTVFNVLNYSGVRVSIFKLAQCEFLKQKNQSVVTKA